MTPHIEIGCDGCAWSMSIPCEFSHDTKTWVATAPLPDHRCENHRAFTAYSYFMGPWAATPRAVVSLFSEIR